jgi:hypothetical protein
MEEGIASDFPPTFRLFLLACCLWLMDLTPCPDPCACMQMLKQYEVKLPVSDDLVDVLPPSATTKALSQPRPMKLGRSSPHRS